MEQAAMTHIGLVRQVNEDGYALLLDTHPYRVVMVADGMGGHRAGEVASSVAIEEVESELRQRMKEGIPEDVSPLELVTEAIQIANQAVYRRASSTPGCSGMGTTIVVALYDRKEVWLGFIGDSRAYLINKESIRQLTDDHSLVNELVKSGQITAEEANNHPQRNILTRSLGTDLYVQVDTLHTPWVKDDILLLCSDGLTNLISEEIIADVLRGEGTMESKLQQLVNLALQKGGNDNITVVAVRNTDEDEERGDGR
ncbi:protein phosphatase [Collibacillus ludicampi]|jgi:serine/threonine protein phosphatase PrpC|uniref:Protein phosphatase n=1 Tax=Collibacillus ludicampi TaxID=2771369 RepID=A0AAV4LJG9_9BACL|nr:Stp1/IreP family PP2C-type Ser/Thr phosphatase [Collibacillus ludicampi]GIM47532.1 protein phosphatase [Collibacillus ludicampi]